MNHEDYDMEAAERANPVLVCMADIPPLSPAERVRLENAYRRGYTQGWSDAAVASMEKIATPGQVCDFSENELHRWRYKRHNGSFELPPRLHA